MAPLQFSKRISKPSSMGTGGSGHGPKLSIGGLGGVLHAVNIPLLLCVLALLALGLVTLYAVTLTDKDYSISKQCMSIGIGVVAGAVVWAVDYRRLGTGNAAVFGLLALDVFVILLPMTPLGFDANGARSWIAIGPLTLQPSEIGKPITIVMMALFVSRYGGNISSGKDFLKCVGLLLVPTLLLAKEDLGTGLVILIIGFVIIFVGGANMRWILVTVMVCAVGVAGLLVGNYAVSTWTGGETQIIKEYQMSRLLVFVDPDNPDYANDAYNLNQAKIAIGSGEITGKGWGNATQSNGGFLPESATDFIFCVYAEQFGFVGSALLLLLYLALLASTLWIGLSAGCLEGSLIVAGVMGMWLFQIIENIGMDIGLMPITGIPLPFMSYGGSFMIANFICIGLLMNVWMRRGVAAAKAPGSV
ncbi:MAG: FtsW/RodA/SpoVE family cell cycle protein [Coriobacteriales bacterium]